MMIQSNLVSVYHWDGSNFEQQGMFRIVIYDEKVAENWERGII